MASKDLGLVIRNALMLGGSLLATWGVALVVRLIVPRYLGPELFGRYNYAEALAGTCFVFLEFGLDTYIQKEIPRRPEHVKDFFGGIVAVRCLLSVVVFAVMVALGWAADSQADTLWMLVFFGIAGLLTVQSSTLMTLLYATRTVGRLAVLNVVAKVLWGAMAFVAVVFHAPVYMLAVTFLLTEIVRVIGLWRLVKGQLDLKVEVHWRSTWTVMLASTPYFVNMVVTTVYGKIGVNIMAFVTTDIEIGWYGAALSFAGLSMLMAPLINWVLLPQFSRAGASSEEELLALLRRSIEGVVQVAIPVCLAMGLGAELLIGMMYGEAFRPAITTLRVLAPMFVVTYVAILAANCLIIMGRGWTLTTVSIGSLIVNAVLNLSLVSWLAPGMGDGGAGIVTGCVCTGVEALVAITMMSTLGRRALDGRLVSATLKSVVVTIVVILADRVLPLPSLPRVIVDMVLYVALILLVRAVRIGDVMAVVHAVRARRAGGGDSSDDGVEPAPADQPAA